MEFYRNFLFEYSFMGIVKLQFTRRNEIWCKILEIEDLSKNVRKMQDRMSLNNITFSIIKILDENSLIKGDVFTSCYSPSCDNVAVSEI